MKIEDEKEYNLQRCTSPEDCKEYTKLGKDLTEEEIKLLEVIGPKDWIGKDLNEWKETMTSEEIIEKIASMYNSAITLIRDLMMDMVMKGEKNENR